MLIRILLDTVLHHMIKNVSIGSGNVKGKLFYFHSYDYESTSIVYVIFFVGNTQEH